MLWQNLRQQKPGLLRSRKKAAGLEKLPVEMKADKAARIRTKETRDRIQKAEMTAGPAAISRILTAEILMGMIRAATVRIQWKKQ